MTLRNPKEIDSKDHGLGSYGAVTGPIILYYVRWPLEVNIVRDYETSSIRG